MSDSPALEIRVSGLDRRVGALESAQHAGLIRMRKGADHRPSPREFLLSNEGAKGNNGLGAACDPAVVYHTCHAWCVHWGDIGQQLADLFKDWVVDKVGDRGGGFVSVPAPVNVVVSAGISASTSVMVYPDPREIHEHLRILRYIADPIFSRGKNRATARALENGLLEAQPYLRAEHTADMLSRMNTYMAEVEREKPASIRQRVSRSLRAWRGELPRSKERRE